jgi:hypothetical protein
MVPDEHVELTMTDWKDPLLEKWWAECSEETRRKLQQKLRKDAITPARVLIDVDQLAILDWKLDVDLDRLRDLIDAELREGRELKHRARAVLQTLDEVDREAKKPTVEWSSAPLAGHIAALVELRRALPETDSP